MARPAILAVDDDANVLRAVERDLRRHYSENYRILTADSGSSALAVIRKLQERNDATAMFVVDHRMPQMSGIEFLSQAIELCPDAKRVLLTAYADTDAAIKAINEIKLDHYLMKPWDPPEQNLYPVLDDLLEEWMASYRPPYEGIKLLGTRWSPKSYVIREFLARNHVPYKWLDVELAEQDPEVKQAVESIGAETALPVIIFTDGQRIVEPSTGQIAEQVGLHRRPDTNFYDVVIIGGGPGGLAAAVYGASEGLKTVIVEREAPGGQAGLSSRIENYLGFPSGLSGGDLTRRAVAQARRFGAEILAPDEVQKLRVDGRYRAVTLADGTELSCHTVLIATGVQWRTLDVPGVDRLHGAGVYYGAGSTEAMSCRGEDVYIVGGANSAGQAAMNFSQFARRVILLVRGESLAASMSKYLIDDIEKTPNIDVQYGAQIVAVHGSDHLERISIACSKTGSVDEVPASSVFVFIGALPHTKWLDGLIKRDDKGFIITGPDLLHDGKAPEGWPLERDPGLLETSIPGVFAIGDVRHGSIKRVASSVGEGSIAVQFIHKYLASG